MQTFLPLADFDKCARVLDGKRLNKQLVECQQIFNALIGKTEGWKNHPAIKMWRGHEFALYCYACALHRERNRRYQNPVPHKSFEYILDCVVHKGLSRYSATFPEWLGDERLHSSHRANLIRKDPIHYGAFGWVESPDLPYWWPV